MSDLNTPEKKNRILNFIKPRSLGGEMSFFDHIETLRWHIIRSVIVLVILSGVFFANKSFLFDTLIFGPKNIDFWTYRKMCELGQFLNMGDKLCITDIGFRIMNNQMAGQFTLHITTALLAGFIVGFPYIIWELWRFVKPGLTTIETQYANGVVFFSSLLFLIGVLFGYYIIVPMSINFLGTYTISPEILNQISFDSYLSTVATLSLGAGIVFELPMIVYFLSKLGIVTPALMRANRKYEIVGILLVAAIITPSPDASTQLLVSLPLFILFEISIFVSGAVERNRKKNMLTFEEEYK